MEPGTLGERLISILQEPAPKPHMPDGELEESYCFALSIVPDLNCLSRERRIEVKKKIIQLLDDEEPTQQPLAPHPYSSSWLPHQPPRIGFNLPHL